MSAKVEREFISRLAASRLIDAPGYVLDDYAERGLIRILRLPGLAPRFNRDDLVALKNSCISPARAGDLQSLSA